MIIVLYLHSCMYFLTGEEASDSSSCSNSCSSSSSLVCVFIFAVFSSKRYGHERAFQMAVNCKEADRAQAAAGGGGAPGGPPQDLFAAPTPKGHAAGASPAAAAGNRRSRATTSRKQQQQSVVQALSPGRSSKATDSDIAALQQAEGEEDEAVDSATDTRTDEGSVRLAAAHAAAPAPAAPADEQRLVRLAVFYMAFGVCGVFVFVSAAPRGPR